MIRIVSALKIALRNRRMKKVCLTKKVFKPGTHQIRLFTLTVGVTTCDLYIRTLTTWT